MKAFLKRKYVKELGWVYHMDIKSLSSHDDSLLKGFSIPVKFSILRYSDWKYVLPSELLWREE